MMKRKSRSSTRLVRRAGQLIIYYQPKNEQVEEEMMKITVVKGDSKRPSKSSKSIASSSSSDVSSKKSNGKNKTKTSSQKTSRGTRAERTDKDSSDERNQDELDEDVLDILENLETLNEMIRKKFGISNEIEDTTFSKSVSSNCHSKNSKTPEDYSNLESISSSSILTAKAYDWQGQPITCDPFALTPFPNARFPVAKLRVCPEKLDAKKQLVPTRSSSSTQNQRASSPTTRERARRLLEQVVSMKRSAQ